MRHTRLAAADETEATEAKPLEPSTGSQRRAVVVTTLVVTPLRSAPRIRTKQALDTSHGGPLAWPRSRVTCAAQEQ